MHGQTLALTPGDRLLRQDDLRFLTDQEAGASAGGIDLHGAWLAIVRYRWMMLAIVLVALAAGAASIWFAEPVYRAQATIQIDPQSPRVTGAEDVVPDGGRAENDRMLKTQVDLIASRSTAQNVAARLGLDNDEAFLREAGLAEQMPGAEREARVAAALQKSLSVSSPQDTRVIAIAVDSRDPALAARAANSFAETFITDSLQRRLDTYAYSRNFLQGQLAVTKARLERSERNLVDYARSVGLVDAGTAAGIAGNSNGERRSITAASLVELNTALSQAQAARMQAQQRWQQAVSTPLMSLPDVLANPAIQNLSRQRAELESTLQQERQRRQDDHPAIVQAKAQIAELDRQIAVIAGGVRESIGNQYRVAAGQESALRGNVDALKSATLAEQGLGVRYNILRREADTNRNLYNTLLQRYHEMSAQAANTVNPISIIDKAQLPTEPAYPRPALNMALAGLAGVALALGAALTRARMDDKLHGPADAERELNAPLLGVVPLLRRGETLDEALLDPRSAVTEAHHAICLALDPVARTQNHSVLLLTSTCPDEGKSTTALKLATHLVAADRRVLVIDGDMRRGSLHRLLGLPNACGFANLLSLQNETRLEQAEQFCDRYGFTVLTRGRTNANPAALLANGRLSTLLGEAAKRFDAVIIDGPPVLGLADAPRLGGTADATIFVVEANRTSSDHARIALRRLTDAGIEQVGLVLTKYDSAKDRHGGYADGYNYGHDDLEGFDEAPVRSRDDQLQLAD
ncbi:polysaccharide biosynthesis tyrosine autokinase [Sphingomonas ginkgonis]|uniref:Polysaccharide biosynthesis tyrosine autokinase n=1 Tax=Sphingomonas ginkgonis TaxID=2315330 RepID=A0A429VBT1_9SPHN|nr:polysaccharide biosynthesis tyrosine autokinase [Sphingomonas ginkgonis]RST31445.1 polysaccharide biosynthesis tyrosine autokinase [Sphingomonas ginkgonis]